MPDDPAPLTTDDLADWLGIAPGERLESPQPLTPSSVSERFRRRQRMSCSIMALGAVLSVFGMIFGVLVGLPEELSAVVFMAGFLVLLGGAASMGPLQQAIARQPWLPHGDMDVTADVTGLHARGQRLRAPWFVPWTSISALDPVYGAAGEQGLRTVERWQLTCDDGRKLYLRADAKHADRLLRAAREVIAARHEGRPIWDAGSVPETGLSRMTGDPALDDTSLSRAEELDA